MSIKSSFGIFILFLVIILYAFIEGFRMPSLWSINYYLPSFFDGFYRRALPGTILSFLGDLKFNYYTIATIQFSVLISLLLWIYYIFQKNLLLMLIISLYLVSPAGGYLFNEVGYIEQLLYLILFISITLFKKHKIISIILFSSSMFIHELALFATLPIYFTYVYITTKNLKQTILYIIPSILFFLIIFIFFQVVPIDTVELFKEKVSNASSYPLRNAYYTVFTSEITGSRNKIYYTLDSLNQIFLLCSLAATTSILVYKISKKQILIAILFFLTAVAPLLLGFFGWDVYRWYFLSLSSLTTVLIIILLHYQVVFTEMVSIQRISVLFIIIYSLLISNMYLVYFDIHEYKPRPFNKESVNEVMHEYYRNTYKVK